MFKKIIDENNYFNLSPQRIIELRDEGYSYADMLVQCAFEAIRDSGIDWTITTTYEDSGTAEAYTCGGCDIMYNEDSFIDKECPVTYFNEELNTWLFHFAANGYVTVFEPCNNEVWNAVFERLWESCN